jgi:hypothetical protein
LHLPCQRQKNSVQGPSGCFTKSYTPPKRAVAHFLTRIKAGSGQLDTKDRRGILGRGRLTLFLKLIYFSEGEVPAQFLPKTSSKIANGGNKMIRATIAFPKVLGYLALISGVLFLSPCSVITANAQGTGPCAEDMEKFCKGVEPGGGRIYNCFKEHAKELSPACQEHIKEMKAKVREAKKECADDVDKFCQDVKAGSGRIAKCLKQHENELSTECKEVMAKAKKKGAQMKKQEQAY